MTSIDAPLPEPKRPSRWIDLTSFALVAVALGITTAAALPSLIQTLSRGATASAPLPSASAVNPFTQEPEARPRGGFVFAPDDDSSDALPLQKPRARAHDTVPRAMGTGGKNAVKLGLVRKDVPIYDAPGDGEVLGKLRAGDTVMLVKELDDWLLVVSSSGTESAMGWVARGGISVR